jgi:glycosyltransferase involved in cell wall biosynthesis
MPSPSPALSAPRVSILLPVRDAQATLARAVESCLAQTFGDFELIAVDDCSRDGSRALLESFARLDARVRVRATEPPGGLVPALQLACQEARGELLARMDADDFSHPERFAEQVRLMDARPDVAVCGCGIRIVGSVEDANSEPADGFRRYEAWINALTEPDAIAAERFAESPLVHPTALIRREALEAVGGYRDSVWAEDYDLWLRMLERGFKLAKVPRILFDWSDGPRRLTRTASRYSQRLFLQAKAHYLARMPAVRERGVMISGAGPIGKRLAEFLRAEGVRVEAFLDIGPRRVGQRIGGVPVLSAEKAPRPDPSVPLQLIATGRGGRGEEVARMFEAQGFQRGIDLFRAA